MVSRLWINKISWTTKNRINLQRAKPRLSYTLLYFITYDWLTVLYLIINHINLFNNFFLINVFERQSSVEWTALIVFYWLESATNKIEDARWKETNNTYLLIYTNNYGISFFRQNISLIYDASINVDDLVLHNNQYDEIDIFSHTYNNRFYSMQTQNL